MGTKKATSDQFRACRQLVHDDAFQAQITLHMVEPLLGNKIDELRLEYLRAAGLFFRRALSRDLALVLCRLLDKPNDRGSTGVTASISSLLGMARSEGVLAEVKFHNLTTALDKIKKEGANREYDLVHALRDLRNIQIAHSLIPYQDLTEQIWALHLLEFAEALFGFVADLEMLLTEATGVALSDLRRSASSFERNANEFWGALRSMKK